MSLFDYRFIFDITTQQKVARRFALDAAASTAQWSALLPLLAFPLCRLAFSVLSRGEGRRLDSLHGKAAGSIGGSSLITTCRRFLWWAAEPITLFGQVWGSRGEWLVGLSWMVWLLVCCVVGTGDDYLHVTKRFGIVAASQLPLHYLLATKSSYSPIQLLTHFTHEELNPYHQILGRIILILLSLHGSFYLNFFIQSGYLAKRIKDVDVITGLTGLTLFSIIGTTALGAVRRWNYRVFYFIHVSAASLLLPLMYFHVPHIRPYILQAVVVLLVQSALRYINSNSYEGSISILPNTDLVQVRIPLPAAARAKNWPPGSHLFLSRPIRNSTSSTSRVLNERLRTNPFTIASLPTHDKELLLVARTYCGHTLKLAELAQNHIHMSLTIEGPYGAATRMPDLNQFHRVLLVAGGSGASFMVPLWRSIAVKKPGSRFIWAVRNRAEIAWVQPYMAGTRDDSSTADGIEVYLTGGNRSNLESDYNGIELRERERLMNADTGSSINPEAVTVREGRPDLAHLVNETIADSAGLVAVLVCGPEIMVRSLRKSVRDWVSAGRDVFWHAEFFGY